MNIVAIDPGLTMGVALYDKDAPKQASFELLDLHAARKRSIGDALVQLETALKTWLDPRDVLVIEEPCPKSMTSAKVQYAVYGACLKVAAELDKAYVLYNNQTIKRFAGRYLKAHTNTREQADLYALFDKAPENKINSLVYYYLISGGGFIDHNIADAAALLGLALSELAHDNDPYTVQREAETRYGLQLVGC